MRGFRRIVLAAALVAGAGATFAAAPANAYCQPSPFDIADGLPDPADRDNNGCVDCPNTPSALQKLGFGADCIQ